ncbi:transglutaminase [Pseudoruegeria sp. SK021]|nr:transglutaminase [Pseudoruegeria sp. SK021]
MIFDINVHLHYRMADPTDILLQIEAAELPDQPLHHANIDLSDTAYFARTLAEDGIGNRIWMQVQGDFVCDYTSRVEVTRPVPDLSNLQTGPLHLLPGDVFKYLMPSRYCPSDEFQSYVFEEFGHLSGGARVVAIRDWIEGHFRYLPGVSTSQTTALDTFVQRQGICRDFAHVLITLARASAIPARFCSVFAPGVTPQDFHAVAQVYLDGAWHLVDPTGMASADSIAIIGVGQDAAHVAFLTSFNYAQLLEQTVSIDVPNL